MTQPTPPVLDGRYELIELLGEGGMGKVYKARHTRLGKIFAIKSLRNLSPDPIEQAKFLEAFETEARTLAELDHPALAQVSDFFEADGVHFLVMEFVNGKTLSRVAELAPRLLSQRRILQWALELCDVLNYLHSQVPPVIVRDLKPDNVMIDEKRRLRLLDFGIAKRLQAGVGTRDIIKGMGTAEYAPLEQYGQASTDQRSDIYALGGTLYFLLTELPPPPAWRRASEGAVVIPPSQVNATVTPDFEALVLRMMALKREDRPQSIAEVQEELSAIAERSSSLSGNPAEQRKAPLPPPPQPATDPGEVSPRVPPPPAEPGHPRTPRVPPPPAYAPDSGAVKPAPPGQRYSMPGTALPDPRTEIKKPVTAPSSTGRVPRVSVLTVRNLRRYATPPQAVRFCPGQPLVAVAGRYLQVWNTQTDQIASKLWTGEQELTSLDYSHDGRFLTAAETEGGIHLYDLVHEKHTAQLGRRSQWGLFTDRVRDICVLHGLPRLAVASDTSNIRIFDTVKGEVVQVIDWHQSGLFSKLSKKTLSLASSRDGLLAAGGADGSLSLYEPGASAAKQRISLGPGEIVALDFSADGNFLAVAASRRVLLVQVPELKVVHELKHPANPLSVSISHDLRVVATGASDCHIRLFHLNTAQELSKLTHHSGAVLDLHFSDLGPSLVSAGNDRRLFVIDFAW
jgi:serine/threonine protein kinase